MGVQAVVVFIGLTIALSVGIAGTLKVRAPHPGWPVIGLLPTMWALLYLTERVIGREIWQYTAPCGAPRRWTSSTHAVLGRSLCPVLVTYDARPLPRPITSRRHDAVHSGA